ncbi:MAG: hypothetical protein LBR18_06005 [Tannerella sp.]|jgi:hypothetical protein|nr:hypothetical protein [Tannerella sp.]
MDNRKLSLSLSGMTFALDEEAQKTIIQNVTANIVEQISEKIGKDISKLIEELKLQLSAYNITFPKQTIEEASAPAGEAQVKRRGGRRKKVETESAIEPSLDAESTVAEKPKKGRKRKNAKNKPGRKPKKFAFDAQFEEMDISPNLKGFLRKSEIITVSDAVTYCDAEKLNALIQDKSVSKHSMIYQLVKLLRESGYSSPEMRKFQISVEKLADREKKKRPKQQPQ